MTGDAGSAGASATGQLGLLRVLLVEEHRADALLLREALADAYGEFDLEVASSVGAALERLPSGGIDVVLVDLACSDGGGLAGLERIARTAPDVPVVVLTAIDDDETAVAAVGRGAQDYLVKGSIDDVVIGRVLRQAVERQRLGRYAGATLKQREVLAEIGSCALEGLPLPELAARTASAVAEALEVDAVAVLELAPDGSGLVLRAAHGPVGARPGERVVGAGSEELCERVLRSRKAEAVADARREDGTSSPGHLPATVRSEVAAPLHTGGAPRGVVHAVSSPHAVFGEGEVAFVTAVANVLAQALRRTDVEEALRERVEELTALAGITRDARTELTWEELAQRAAGRLIAGMSCPELTSAVIELDGARAVAGGPAELDGPAVRRPLIVDGVERGSVTVRYAEPIDLLDEEAELVRSVADALTLWAARRESAEREHEANARREAVFEHARGAILMADDEGRHVDVNPAACTLTGYPREELLGRRIWELTATTVPEGEAVAAWLEFLANGSMSGDYVLRHRDGREIVVEFRAAANVLPGQHLSVLRDVTERRRAEGARDASERLFRRLAEGAHDVVYRYVLRPSPHYAYISPAVSDVTGYTPAEFYAEPRIHLRCVHPDDRERFLDIAPVLDGEQQEVLVRVRHRAGRWIWLEDHRSPVTEGGRVVAVQGIARDVTRRQEAEEAMRRALDQEREAAEQLRRLEEMRPGFLQAVSHELRTPLTALSGYAQTLLSRLEALPADRIGTIVGRLVANASRLERLLTGLLDVDRLECGLDLVQPAPVDVGELVARVVAGTATPDHEVVVVVEDRPATVDPAKVERVVENLVANALRHTPPGTIIEIRTEPLGEQGVRLLVEDDGPGVPDELGELVFAPFVQGGEAIGSASPGTGTGLALVARIAALHRGCARVEPRDGGGARFVVDLPGPDDAAAVEWSASGRQRGGDGADLTELGRRLLRTHHPDEVRHLLTEHLGTVATDALDGLPAQEPADRREGSDPEEVVTGALLVRHLPRLLEDARKALMDLARRGECAPHADDAR